MMQATHPHFDSEQQANEYKARLERLGGTVSQPWQDEHNNWRLTVLAVK